MMTEMQKQFEEWAKSVSHNMALRETNDRRYLSYETQIAYEAWQASRAAVVVKLPLFCVDGVDAAEYRDDVIEALDEAGIGYK